VHSVKVKTVAVSLIVAIGASSAMAATGTATVAPTSMDESQLRPVTATIDGGARPVQTTRTIPHWFGATLNPQDGITYGYNMVGADPNSCSGAACDVTVQVDVTPINLRFDGVTLSGEDVLGATLASPLFALNDYGSTQYATTGDWFTAVRGPGGVLSQGDAGIPLQLEDATMRAQFDKTGSSPYHVRLHPNVLPAVTIDVPAGQGTAFRGLHSGRLFGLVQYLWWTAAIQQLESSADPTHLALYLTNDVFLEFGHGISAGGCCVIGFHSAVSAGINEGGASHGVGNAPVHTMAWASWTSPGVFAGANGGVGWALQDIDALSHEISEWADDPFADTTVEPWPAVPGFPQYGCSPYLETGDPVGNAGFAMGTNTFDQAPNLDGTSSADGYYHPEDEVMLPWFMRLAPNLVSEPTQSPTANIGRYTFMGSLDQFAGLTGPPPPCG